MSNNFKITTGNRYFSKAGHDSAAGTAAEPRKTISLAGMTNGQIAVVGAGDYPTFGTVTASVSLQGDGKAIVRGGSFSNTQDFAGWPVDIELIGCSWTKSAGAFITRPLRSIIRNSTFIVRVLAGCSDGLFINSTITIGSTSATQDCLINTSIFRTCTITIGSTVATANPATLVNSDVDETSVIVITSGRGATLARNNIRGIVRVDGVDYELKRDKAGNTINPNPSIADLVTATGFSAIYTNGNFSQDPRYIDAATENFCLQSDSPNIRAANNGISNIGGHFARVATSVNNTDNGNAAGVKVLPSAEINTTIPTAYVLNSGETQGFVDYVFRTNGFVLGIIDINTLFAFDSDFAGGTVQNNNVPDSQPLTSSYAKRTQTNANTGNTTTIQVPTSAGVLITDTIRVNGQVRTITTITPSGANSILTLNSALAAAVASGTTVTFGTAPQIAALNPNRLTFQLRTRSNAAEPTTPLVDSEWDNGLDPAYLATGVFFEQEIGKQPTHIIQGSNVWGGGDSNAPTGIAPQTIAAQWVNVRVYLRDNYSSNGL